MTSLTTEHLPAIDFESELAEVKRSIQRHLVSNPMREKMFLRFTYSSETLPFLYLRMRPTSMNGMRYGVQAEIPSLVVANIEVAEELRGRGFGTWLVQQLAVTGEGYSAVEVELVHNAGFANKLRDAGFQYMEGRDDLQLNLFRLVGHTESQ